MTSSVPRMRRVRLARPNGSDDGGAQRTDLEAPAPIGGESVRRPRDLARFERREQESRRAATAVERVRHRERRQPPVRVRLHDHVDAPVDADLESLPQVPVRLQVDRVVAHPQPGHREQQQTDAGEHDQLHQAEDPRPDVEPGRGTEQRPAAPSEHAPQSWRLAGTGTLSSTEPSTSAALTPRIIASGESTSRCSSTDGASALMSSGTT